MREELSEHSSGEPGPREDTGFPERPGLFSAACLLTFLILFGFWIVFSARFDAFHLTLGILSSALVAASCRDFLFADRSPSAAGLLRLWLGLIGYLPWILGQIFMANLHILYLVFHPRMNELIDPHIIEFDSRLKSAYSRTSFANSITLTPGTITVDVTVLGRFSVHCIDTHSGESLPGKMENKLATVFEE